MKNNNPEVRAPRALVLGRGKSGTAAEAVLKDLGYQVDFADGYDLVVTSPGLVVKSELQLGCEELKRRGWKLLAVTGSKGKSSVVKLVAEALGGIPCGNYGRPVTDLLNLQPPTTPWAVVEVSSFQLETTNLPPDTFEAAAILNLQEDHLDRHGCVEVYHALKRKLLGMTRQPFDETALASLASSASLLVGSYFDNPILRSNGLIAIALLRAVGVTDQNIAHAFATFKPLPHRMNLVAEQNGVRYIDDSKATSLAALAAGVIMATSSLIPPPSSLIPHPSPLIPHPSSLLPPPSLLLIAGGLPKGDDPKSVLPILTKRVKKVYLIGRCAEVFSAAWKSSVECELCGTMEVAVESARREAVKGDVVLLSPGTASFDQFKSFGERGDVFADLVQKGK